MWNLQLERLPALSSPPRFAIETGTCRGNGTRLLARSFERVITIELSRDLHEQARARFASLGLSNVECHHGDSAALLPGLLSKLAPAEPVFFFLDAHWSGDSSVDWKASRWQGFGVDTAHLGESGRTPSAREQCPLDRELAAIAEHCSGPAAILIDDLKNLPPSGSGLKDREFPGEDWSHLSRELLLATLGSRLESVIELSDPAQLYLSLHALTPRPKGRTEEG